MGSGDDRLRGGDGNDSLFGSSGDNNMAGGAGNDAFHLGGEHDVITDFQIGQDVLVTPWEDSEGNPLADVTISEAHGWTTITVRDLVTHQVTETTDIHAVGIPASSFHDICDF